MSNFKSGSGNLDFGGSDGDDDDETSKTNTESEEPQDETSEANSTPPGSASLASSRSESTETEGRSDQPPSDPSSAERSVTASSSTTQYPYFVRRSNVGDERDTRLEIHVRDKVANQEGQFRNELAEQLGTSEVSKTDAREFALLAAFHNPEQVAELMEEEGFGALD
ncbi:acyl-CoA dehydrogenase [Natrinema halophilum]|uniref:acyl-CoA dehydrogenase n=1 Tax=Natrinema halophilum TaxID=1699371 RepID=UPI001F375811|nr:acyl-CoA dehydrogenase [Natrinema halophilum]UHQ96229.1 acyl-CoA dehydrogenase [Natrinema halophilum]